MGNDDVGRGSFVLGVTGMFLMITVAVVLAIFS
jgi:hypothetical protein